MASHASPQADHQVLELSVSLSVEPLTDCFPSQKAPEMARFDVGLEIHGREKCRSGHIL
jgi:hypothetical protein